MGMKPSQDPAHIAIKNRQWAVEGRRKDAPSGGAANPREKQPAVEILWPSGERLA
jgi:hypothetical protein